MRHLAHLALATAGVLALATTADAAPRKQSKAARATKARAERADAAKAMAKRARERLARAQAASTEDSDDDSDADTDRDTDRDDDDGRADDDDAPAHPARLAGRAKRKAARITHAREQADDDDATLASADGDDADEAPRHAKKAKHKKAKHTRPSRDDADDDTDTDSDRVAFADRSPSGDEIEMPAADAREEEDESDDEVAAPLVVKHTLGQHRAKKWSVAVGPYLWASSVDANVSVGSASVGAGADFTQTAQHAKFGAEGLAEVRYGRFSFGADVLYGVIGLEGAREVGPVMVNYDGTATSTLVDGIGGVTLLGNDHSLFSLEARGGVRYQRTVVEASVGVAGADFAPPSSVDSGADAIAGGRVFVRPIPRVFASAALDTRVFGQSTNTWSATADAGVRLGHFQLSLGYRTVTEDRGSTNVRMYGPRAAVQVAF